MLTGKLTPVAILLQPVLFICLLTAAYFTVAVPFLSGYFIVDTNIVMGLVLAPYMLIVEKNIYAYRYVVPMIACLVILYFIPVKTSLFLVLLFSTLLLVESCIGKINNIFIFLLLLLSPIFNYVNSLIGFPIRLWLSEVTGLVLNSIGKKVEIAGNIIIMDNAEFSVDTACAGLNMLMVSLIITLFIVAYMQRKSGKHFSSLLILVFMGTTFILNTICNLLRIITLVLFRIMPNNKFHDLIGIVYLLIYVILPLIYISKLKFKASDKARPLINTQQAIPHFNIALNIIVAAAIFCIVNSSNFNQTNIADSNNYYIAGFKKEIGPNGIVKFENNNALIYLKPVKFYAAEHNPLNCWRGSGYEFKQMRRQTVNGIEIYTGLLKKGNDSIYTAWWFSNGKCKTISHFVWRWQAMKGEATFCLININTSSETQLAIEIKKIFNTTITNETAN